MPDVLLLLLFLLITLRRIQYFREMRAFCGIRVA
jgi:hypothetical protein